GDRAAGQRDVPRVAARDSGIVSDRPDRPRHSGPALCEPGGPGRGARDSRVRRVRVDGAARDASRLRMHRSARRAPPRMGPRRRAADHRADLVLTTAGPLDPWWRDYDET